MPVHILLPGGNPHTNLETVGPIPWALEMQHESQGHSSKVKGLEVQKHARARLPIIIHIPKQTTAAPKRWTDWVELNVSLACKIKLYPINPSLHTHVTRCAQGLGAENFGMLAD